MALIMPRGDYAVWCRDHVPLLTGFAPTTTTVKAPTPTLMTVSELSPLNQEANPFWCPEIPAEEFLRSKQHPGKDNAIAVLKNKSKRAPFPSLATTLRTALKDKTNMQPMGNRKSSLISRRSVSPLAAQSRPIPLKDPLSKVSSNPAPWRPNFPPERSHRGGRNWVPLRDQDSARDETMGCTRQSSAFSGLLGSSRCVKSSQSYDSASFVLSDRAEALTMCPTAFQSSESNIPEPSAQGGGPGLTRRHSSGQTHGSVSMICNMQSVQDIQTQALRDDLYGPELGCEGSENIYRAVMQLDAMFSGMRLGDRIMAEDPQTYQAVVNFLADQGLLTYFTLYLFRSCPTVTRLAMSQTMDSRNGLNEAGRDALKAFLLPNSFMCLAEIDFTGVQISGHLLKQLVLLPGLKVLVITSTGIDDLDLLPLTALQAQITELYLANNPEVTDNCLGVLSCITFLHSIDVYGTGVTMEGIRGLIGWFAEEDRPLFYLKMPASCQQYMDSLQTLYCVDIPSEAPFTASPEDCERLSIGDVKANLRKHMEFNSSITLRGSESSLRKKLVDILRLREADLLVKSYVDAMQ